MSPSRELVRKKLDVVFCIGAPIGLAELFIIDLSQISLLDKLLLGVDGIDLFLEGLQEILDGEVFGFTLPLVGDKLSGAAGAIGDFLDGFIDNLRDAIEGLSNTSGFNGGADPVSKILFDLLGPDGLDLLKDYDPLDGETAIGIDDIIYLSNIATPGVDPANGFDEGIR